MGFPCIYPVAGLKNYFKTIQAIVEVDFRWEDDGKSESKQS